jgi:hypothetical protein
MAEHSYRAYISYSHSDEAWAAWLQRAIELYRVPRKLVGKETSAGRVPARIRPVFRDREDLSSAVDLEVTVKQALTNSENMTVVSQVSERHEREKAEQLAIFIVDLGERLKSDADLETLSLISAEASQHLQRLDSEKLSPETGSEVVRRLIPPHESMLSKTTGPVQPARFDTWYPGGMPILDLSGSARTLIFAKVKREKLRDSVYGFELLSFGHFTKSIRE